MPGFALASHGVRDIDAILPEVFERLLFDTGILTGVGDR
jgi:hypothetical protein